MKSFMLIAGEASGDALGAELVQALKAVNARGVFFGAGGPKMQAAGVELELDLSAHAVVGIWEVLKHYRTFKRFFDRLLALALEREPECVILIDYPGFNLRFARALRARAAQAGRRWRPKIVYYVSPQIWAWHESRVHQIARDIDLMLAIFPFEKPWYAERKPEFRVEFVGHPLIDRHARKKVAMEPDPRVLTILPGSREREVRKHLPVMLPAARRLASEGQLELELVLPDAKLNALAARLVDLRGVRVNLGNLAEALARSRLAIASSGTVTMECAYFGVPAVVIYKTTWTTYLLGRRFIRVAHLAMPNLLAGEAIYPELIQNEAAPENIYQAGRELLFNPERRALIRAKLERVISTLGEPGAAERAARAILSL